VRDGGFLNPSSTSNKKDTRVEDLQKEVNRLKEEKKELKKQAQINTTV